MFNPAALLKLASFEAIRGAVRWYDEQPREGTGKIGPGILTDVIRDGGMEGYGVAEACPCTRELCQEWQLVIVELERILSEDDWIIRYAPWMALLHPHSHDVAGWTLGAEAWVPDWLGKRRAGIRRAAGCPVHVVACESQPTPMEA